MLFYFLFVYLPVIIFEACMLSPPKRKLDEREEPL